MRFLWRASSAQREVVLGFCSIPVMAKSPALNATILSFFARKEITLYVSWPSPTNSFLSTITCRQTEVSVSSKVIGVTPDRIANDEKGRAKPRPSYFYGARSTGAILKAKA